MTIFRYDLQNLGITLTHPRSKLLYISQEKYAEDWHGIEHTHSFSELFYILEGNGFFSIENKLYPVCTNDFVVINPNIVHTESGQPSSPLKYIVLGIDGLELSADGKEEDLHFYIVNLGRMKEQILFLLRGLIAEIEAKPVGFDQVCRHYLDILLLLLARKTSFSAPLKPISCTSTRLVTLVRRYLDQHYREQISLDQLAGIFHANKYHIVHSFTQEHGVSPVNYLITKRIEEAERLLTTTDFSLSVISRFCGFSSPSYFAQIFKKQRGYSPSFCRKQGLGGNQ